MQAEQKEAETVDAAAAQPKPTLDHAVELLFEAGFEADKVSLDWLAAEVKKRNRAERPTCRRLRRRRSRTAAGSSPRSARSRRAARPGAVQLASMRVACASK